MFDENLTLEQIEQQQEQKWQSLTLADDFLFCKIMSDAELCREMIHRIFPNLDVEKLEPAEPQKTLKLALHVRGIRLDIYTKVARSILDIEVQKRKLSDLVRRPRAYHIVIGMDAMNINSLKSSGRYGELPETYVVFICTFDLFGKGRHVYTFHNYCKEDKEIELKDGAYTIFLNTEGTMNDVSPELKRFLDFVAGRIKSNELEDSFIKTLDEKIKEAKDNTKWRREYMLLLNEFDVGFLEGRDEGFNEGRTEGMAEGRAEGRTEGRAEGRTEAMRSIYERLTASGMSPHEAANFTGWNVDLNTQN